MMLRTKSAGLFLVRKDVLMTRKIDVETERKVSIFILLKNDSMAVKRTICGLREKEEYSNFDVIVLDANSEELESKWVRDQNDITYILFGEDEAFYSNMVNASIKALDIHNDFLVMKAGLVLEKDTLTLLNQVRRESTQIACVSPISKENRKTIAYDDKIRYVLETDNNITYFQYDVFSKTGGFSTDFLSWEIAFKDYQLRVLSNGYKLAYYQQAYFGNNTNLGFFDGQEIRESDGQKLEKIWGMHYFNSLPNYALISRMPFQRTDEFSVLEVGCDCGCNLLEIKNQFPNCHIYGMELNESAARIANYTVETYCGNIEENDAGFKNRKYDMIIFGDVLEHLRDPEKVLVRCKEFLTDNGYILSSIPNLQHISVLHQLINGFFTYQESGLLDKTHIHFFTAIEIQNMFSRAGYEIKDFAGTFMPLDDVYKDSIKKLKSVFPDINEGLMEVFQYQVCAKVI